MRCLSGGVADGVDGAFSNEKYENFFAREHIRSLDLGLTSKETRLHVGCGNHATRLVDTYLQKCQGKDAVSLLTSFINMLSVHWLPGYELGLFDGLQVSGACFGVAFANVYRACG